MFCGDHVGVLSHSDLNLRLCSARREALRCCCSPAWTRRTSTCLTWFPPLVLCATNIVCVAAMSIMWTTG